MDRLSLFALAVALAMDAFAVALAAGAVLKPVTGRHLFRLGFHFGLFQGMMPIIGWLAGMTVHSLIAAWDHWIAFGLLTFIGVRMIHEALQDDDNQRFSDPSRGMNLVMLSIATSIDALAVGLTLAVIEVVIWGPSLVIGLVACIFTIVGVLLGERVGAAWGGRVEIIGGCVLLAIGGKILFSHLFFA